MPTAFAWVRSFQLGPLLRAEPAVIGEWIRRWTTGRTLQQVLVIVIGAGAFGAALGGWRAPEQALFSAVKLPVVLLATAVGNGLINGMLAPLLGVRLSLRESFAAVLTSFALTAAMLGAFSPLMVFLVWNLPLPDPEASESVATHAVVLLTLVGMIAFAGIAANVRLLQLLRRFDPGSHGAVRLLFSWLAVNLLLGSQVSWVLRPFTGRAHDTVCFFDPNALRGSFFEEVWRNVGELWTHLAG